MLSLNCRRVGGTHHPSHVLSPKHSDSTRGLYRWASCCATHLAAGRRRCRRQPGSTQTTAARTLPPPLLNGICPGYGICDFFFEPSHWHAAGGHLACTGCRGLGPGASLAKLDAARATACAGSAVTPYTGREAGTAVRHKRCHPPPGHPVVQCKATTTSLPSPTHFKSRGLGRLLPRSANAVG
jgi:hypothetical protein